MSIFRKIEYVEKEKIIERVVVGEPHRVRLFRAYRRVCVFNGLFPQAMDEEAGLYVSCKDAFDANPGCRIEQVDGIRIGNEYFTCGKLEAAHVKRPKRARKA